MKKLLLLVMCLLCILCKANAQGPVFRNYNTSDGLPSSEIYSVLQDGNGYIWLGTDRGLVKFDGYSFKTYTTAEGLADNTVFELFNGNDGRLWFKTFSAKIGYAKNDSVYSYPYNNLIRFVLPFQVLRYMMFTDNNEVCFTKDSSGKVIIFNIDSAGNLSTPKNINQAGRKRIYLNKKGERLVTGDLFAKQTEIYSQESGKKIGQYTSINVSLTLYTSSSKKGNGFFLCADGYVYHINKGICTKIIKCADAEIISFFTDANDDVWVGYKHIGVEQYIAKINYQKNLSELNKLSVSSIHQDNEGGFWFATLENGLYYFPHLWMLSYTEANGLPLTKIIRIENIKDNIALITASNSVLLQNKLGFSVLQKNAKNYVNLCLGDSNIVYKTCNIKYDFPGIKDITLDHSKRIYNGKKYVWNFDHSHIAKYNKNGKRLKEILFEKFSRVVCLYETTQGSLLVGTVNGLYKIDNDSIYPLKEYNSLFGYRISDIKPFGKNHIIIATIGYGLFIIKENDFSSSLNYTTADGMPSMMCNVILNENDSFVWVGTNRGLCRITNVLDKKKAEILKIDINDGIVSNEINDVCIVGNNLWLATSKGVSIVPRKLPALGLSGIPIYIENISVNGKILKPFNLPQLSYTQNNISISFTGISYRQAGKLVYKYRMKGDTNWYYTNSRNVVYNGLTPGNYVFEVGIIKPNGQQKPFWTTCTFTILPPFWKTWGFILFVIIISIGIVYFFIHRRISFVRSQEQLKNDLNTYRDKALRDQMNPHFIYNSLNSIQNYILKNDVMASAAFLSKFSQLMRLTFNNTSEEVVTLEKDLEALILYAELENLRFPNKFTLHIQKDTNEDWSRTTIPPLIIQPFIENAILHGLLTKKEPGNIWLTLRKERESLFITITDDGVGRQQSALIKERKLKFSPITRKKAKTSGITTTQNRIEQAWGKKTGKSDFKIIDLHDDKNTPLGTTVQFCLPLTYD